MHLFYAPKVESNTHILSEEESKHAIRVLRLKKHDTVILVNGKGLWCEAVIEEDAPKKCVLTITQTSTQQSERDFKLIVAVAPTKNSARMEWFLEKATEIGIDEIIPLVSDHGERTKIKPERWEKVLVSAMKQSLKAYLPILSEPLKLEQIVSKFSDAHHYLAHCREGEKKHLLRLKPTKKTVVIYIGPEGDFSTREVGLADSHKMSPISLGEARLRTETAALAACHIANLWKHV
jgi:16S rRNA (uracil1498-N3)-methyltransferase